MYSGCVSGGGLVVNLTAALTVHSFIKKQNRCFLRAEDETLTAYWRRMGWIHDVHRLPVSAVTDDRIITEALVLKIFKLTNIERRILRIPKTSTSAGARLDIDFVNEETKGASGGCFRLAVRGEVGEKFRVLLKKNLPASRSGTADPSCPSRSNIHKHLSKIIIIRFFSFQVDAGKRNRYKLKPHDLDGRVARM